MKDLKTLASRFLLGNKLVALLCIASIVLGILSITIMMNFVIDTDQSYTDTARAQYGDGDITVSTTDSNGISDDVMSAVKKDERVKAVSTARWGFITIEGCSIYCAGIETDDLMRSRYRYTSSLMENSVVINSLVSKKLSKSVGDTLHINGIDLEIIEILEDPGSAAANVFLALMPEETMYRAAGTVSTPNALLIQVKKADDINALEKDIRSLDQSLDISKYQKKSIDKEKQSLMLMIFIMAFMVLLVSALFMSSAFFGLMRKTKYDIAVLKMLGSEQATVKRILNREMNLILGIGAVLGYAGSFVVYQYAFGFIARQLSITAVDFQHFHILVSLFCSLVVCGIFKLFLALLLRKVKKQSPNLIMLTSEISMELGGGKTKKSGRKKEKLPGNDLSLAIRLILPKLRENLLIILTITALIVVMTFGTAFINTIYENGNRYYAGRYLADTIMTDNASEEWLSYDDAMKVVKELKADGITNSVLFQSQPAMVVDRDGMMIESDYQLCDLEGMYQQGLIDRQVRSTQAVLKKSFAMERGIEIGDRITITDKFNADMTGAFTVGGIFDNDQWDDILIDVTQKKFLSKADTSLNMIYITGNLDTMRNALDDIQNRYPAVTWSNYQEFMELTNRMIGQRFGLFMICILGLVSVISLGWLNSLYSILEDRRRDYAVLRTLGYGRLRLFKIISVQNVIYLLAGIVFGSMSSALLLWLSGLKQFGFSYYLAILLYMTLLSLLLIPKMVIICRSRKNIELISRSEE